MDKVEDIHHVHAWTLTSNKHVFSAHLKLPKDTGPESQHRALREVQSLLRSEYGFYFTTLQLETRPLDESGAEDLDISNRG